MYQSVMLKLLDFPMFYFDLDIHDASYYMLQVARKCYGLFVPGNCLNIRYAS